MEKILFCASTLSHINNFHLPYIEELIEKGYNVQVMAKSDKGSGDNIIDVNFEKKILSIVNIKNIFSVKKILEKEKFNLVITNTALAGFIVRVAAIMVKNKPFIVHISHGYLFRDKWTIKDRFYLICEKICRKVTNILVVMNNEDMQIAKKYKLYNNKLEFIKGIGFDAKRFNFKNSKELKKFHRDKITILNVGEFSKRKNQKMLIKVFNKIERNDVQIIFIGEGKYFNKCKQLAEKNNRIVFMGHIESVKYFCETADYYVSVSKSEGIPISVLEAMSVGCPVILSNIKGHQDLAEENNNIKLFDNESDLTELINKATKTSRQEYKIEDYYLIKVKRRVMNIYQYALNKREDTNEKKRNI